MVEKNRWYKVDSIPRGLKERYSLNQVRPGTKVKYIDEKNKGLFNKVKVQMKNGDIRKIYLFQIER